MTWRLKVQGVVFAVLVLVALALAVGASWTDQLSVPLVDDLLAL